MITFYERRRFSLVYKLIHVHHRTEFMPCGSTSFTLFPWREHLRTSIFSLLIAMFDI